MSDRTPVQEGPAGRSAVPVTTTGRTRLVAAAAALVTVGAGLGLRAVATGDVAKYGGDALYTLLVLALVVLLAPRTPPARAAGIALAVSWAVELLQLTGLPADLSARSTAARLVLGSTFNAPDLFWYAIGAMAGWLAARALAGRRRTRWVARSPVAGEPGERGDTVA
ncbi:DUF2809 domain-containing protein [Streptomyces sp. Vc74B-19]|uniref:ribosomal maturation YjgA family protein n=1 Tax=unclassified Streptomyces TaxID=2593676 RepID=UPI001BFC191D|nr:DUF2809 domain-containing protein [Streptomyces sp. Vc74B-19]